MCVVNKKNVFLENGMLISCSPYVFLLASTTRVPISLTHKCHSKRITHSQFASSNFVFECTKLIVRWLIYCYLLIIVVPFSFIVQMYISYLVNVLDCMWLKKGIWIQNSVSPLRNQCKELMGKSCKTCKTQLWKYMVMHICNGYDNLGIFS